MNKKHFNVIMNNMDKLAQFYKIAIENVKCCVYFVDRNRKILFWNKSSENTTGYTAREVVGRHCYENILKHIDESGNNLCEGKCPLVQAMETGKIIENRVFLHDKNGARIPVLVRAIPVFGDNNEVLGAVEVFTVSFGADIDHMEKSEIERELYLDPLTRIPNRRYLFLKFREYIKKLRRLNEKFGILFIDLDNFKPINDKFTHLAGDEVLKVVAKTLQMNIKPIDTVARYGGDEFVIILSNIDEESLEKFSQKLLILIEKSEVNFEGNRITPKASIGGTIVKKADTLRTALKRADQNLYKAKKDSKKIAIS